MPRDPAAGGADASAVPRGMLLRVRVRRVNDACSFANKSLSLDVRPGTCVWLRGNSGVGKTQTALMLMGLQPPAAGTAADVAWDPDVPPVERAGMLFQNGVLVDSLTVAENILLAAHAAGARGADKPDFVERHLAMVGLSPWDQHKMPGELSGGMLRRAALAQLLAQHKRLVVLDEPFAGLDADTAAGIIGQLQRVMKEQKTAFVLVSHQEHLAQQLGVDSEVLLRPAPGPAADRRPPKGRTPHVHCWPRALHKVLDYFVYSLPLVVLCFVAAGGAIGMLFGDSLARTEVASQILDALDRHAASWPDMMKMFLGTAKAEVQKMADAYVPQLKASLFCAGMSHLVVLEIAPLLTALLLAGRIGGAYAGEVGTMQATNQNRLLQTLGVSPVRWSLPPTIFSAVVAGPLLTVIGAATALLAGSFAFEFYSLGTREFFWVHVRHVVFHPSDYWQNYAPLVLLYRSLAFQTVTIVVAEVCGRYNKQLQPRGVPLVITTTVVVSGLIIIFLDWLFSFVLVQHGLATVGVAPP